MMILPEVSRPGFEPRLDHRKGKPSAWIVVEAVFF